MKKIAAAIAMLLAASSTAIAQTHVSPVEAESRPESMAVGPDGTLYVTCAGDNSLVKTAFVDAR